MGMLKARGMQDCLQEYKARKFGYAGHIARAALYDATKSRKIVREAVEWRNRAWAEAHPYVREHTCRPAMCPELATEWEDDLISAFGQRWALEAQDRHEWAIKVANALPE